VVLYEMQQPLELGFQRDNILIVGHAGRVFIEGRESFVQALRANPGIIDVALSTTAPFDTEQSLDTFRIAGQPDLILLNRMVISPDFPRFYGMRLAAGRELSATRSRDQISSMNAGDPANTGHNILINEAAAAREAFEISQLQYRQGTTGWSLRRARRWVDRAAW